jgi:hypothetical protein
MKTFTSLFIVFIFGFSSHAEVTFSEKESLVDFYHATNGANWIKKWDLNQPVSTWYGVTVDNDHVVSVVLENNNLSGNLNSSLQNLIFLKKLVLWKNNISGSLLTQIGNLKSLEYLNLGFNKFTGVIPNSIKLVDHILIQIIRDMIDLRKI